MHAFLGRAPWPLADAVIWDAGMQMVCRVCKTAYLGAPSTLAGRPGSGVAVVWQQASCRACGRPEEATPLARGLF